MTQDSKVYGPFSGFQMICAVFAVLCLMALVGIIGFFPTILLLGFFAAMGLAVVYGRPGIIENFNKKHEPK